MRRNTKRALWMAAGAIVGAAVVRGYYANLNPAAEPIAAQYLPLHNAFDTYQAAFEKIPRKLNPKGKNDNPPLSLTERQAALEADAEGLALARLALTQEFVYPRPARLADPLLFKPFASFRVLARLFVAEGETRLEAGDEAGAMQSYLDTAAMGRQMQGGGTAINRMVGMACQGIGQKAIWTNRDSWSAATAKDGAKRLEAIYSSPAPLSINFAEEKAIFQPQLLQMLDAPGAYAPPSQGESDSSEWMYRVKQQPFLFFYTKRGTYDEYSRYMDSLIEATKTAAPPQKILVAPPTNPLIAPVILVFSEVVEADRKERARGALTLTALALQAYRAERGAYPETLLELVPAYLTAIPTDPFADAPLRYRRTADKYLLYSVGPDADNDNGRPLPRPDITDAEKVMPLNDEAARRPDALPDGDIVGDATLFR